VRKLVQSKKLIPILLLSFFVVLPANIAIAQDDPAAEATQNAAAEFDDNVVKCASSALLQLIEGNLGAMVFVAAGIGTIIAIAFGGYRAAVSLLMVALSAFVIRSFVIIHFGEEALEGKDCNQALGLVSGESSSGESNSASQDSNSSDSDADTGPTGPATSEFTYPGPWNDQPNGERWRMIDENTYETEHLDGTRTQTTLPGPGFDDGYGGLPF